MFVIHSSIRTDVAVFISQGLITKAGWIYGGPDSEHIMEGGMNDGTDGRFSQEIRE
tara:strand:- start:111 stop:278 length:168 start_codon:yes stop_codon:yes gene_type:complete